MTTYDQAVFELLTKPDNFRAARALANQIVSVEEKLKDQFWKEVKNQTEEALLQLPQTGVWEIHLNFNGNEFWMQKPEWNNKMAVACEGLKGRPDFGFWCSPDVYDRSKIDQILSIRFQEIARYPKSTPVWPKWKQLEEFNLQRPEVLERILPDSREATASELVKAFVEFLTNHRGAACLDAIHQEAKKD